MYWCFKTYLHLLNLWCCKIKRLLAIILTMNYTFKVIFYTLAPYQINPKKQTKSGMVHPTPMRINLESTTSEIIISYSCVLMELAHLSPVQYWFIIAQAKEFIHIETWRNAVEGYTLNGVLLKAVAESKFREIFYWQLLITNYNRDTTMRPFWSKTSW